MLSLRNCKPNHMQQQPSSFWNRIAFWNIQYWQLLAVVGLYLSGWLLYYLALQLTSEFGGGYLLQTGLNYFAKAICTLPVYWLIFYRLNNWSLQRRILLHVLTCPLYILVWLQLYHLLCDLFGEGYMWGAAMWWDVYIPFLFYLLQFGIFHLYDYYLRFRKEEQKQVLLQQAALQSEITALKAQIQPHFLYNTLNSISAAVPRELEHVREMIARLGDTFRFALAASQEEWIGLEEELQFIRTYLELEKGRYQEKLTFSIHANSSALDYRVPPMLLQPLVENAIKHGVGPSLWPVEIRIEVQRTDKHLNFRISDTGIGWDKDALADGGIGLRNTRKRLAQQFGSDLQLSDNQPSGAVVTFSIPLTQLPKAIHESTDH